MPPKTGPDAESIRLLRLVRREVAALTRASARSGFERDIRELDKTAKRLRDQVAAGKVSRSAANPTLRRFARSRREVTRLMNASSAVSKRTLAAIDAQIQRLRGGD